MSIQIFTEQSALFIHPADRYTTCEAKCYEFATVPDWVTDSIMFKLLQKDNKIKVLGNANDKFIENEGKIAQVVEAPAAEVAEEEPVVNDNEVEALSKMKAKELYELCKEKGLDVEAKQGKDYYLNALKNA